MKVKQLETIWDEIGWKPSKESFVGYIMAHFEQLHLGVRDVVCVNINIFNKDEGMDFVLKCCKAFNCTVVFIDQGEIWITKKENLIFANRIPSRFSCKKEDHILRGKLLGYPDKVIESYFID